MLNTNTTTRLEVTRDALIQALYHVNAALGVEFPIEKKWENQTEAHGHTTCALINLTHIVKDR